jgi:hypothetical protein
LAGVLTAMAQARGIVAVQWALIFGETLEV